MTAQSRVSRQSLLFEDDFDAARLDTTAWLPHYLPAWSSLAQTAASYAIADSCLHLTIPPDQALWLPEDHAPLRVSAVQSGNFSGPVGSRHGQQPYREGAVVREAQTEFWGRTPLFGHFEMRASAVISARSMVAWWLVGLERKPQQSAEICVAEIFGKAVEPGESAAIGAGLHPFRDRDMTEDFAAPRIAIDIEEFHVYALDWDARQVTFSVDGVPLRRCAHPPGYPMQHMIAVFDFPDESNGHDDELTPDFAIDYVREYSPA